MPIPPALHWNLKMPTNVPVDDGGDLIESISVVRRRHCTAACHNVVDCFQACTAHAASGTDISMQDVVLVVLSPKSLVLSSHHQSLSRTRKVRSLQPTKGLFRINRTCGNVSHPSEALARRHRQMARSHFRAGSATCRP